MTGDAGLVAVADGFAAAGCGIEPTSDGTPGIRLDVSELGRELAGGWPVSVSSSGSGLLLTRVSDLVTDADGGEPDDEADSGEIGPWEPAGLKTDETGADVACASLPGTDDPEAAAGVIPAAGVAPATGTAPDRLRGSRSR